jgi:hypothetical protein
LDLLRIFLAASSRGGSAIITLETRKKEITSSYRSVNVTESPATTNTENKKCKKNLARVRRSRMSLEQFMKRKEETKKQVESCHTAGATSGSDNKLVMELEKVEDRAAGAILSPIPHVDGAIDKEDLLKYEFVSNYAEDDIQFTLEEIFPERSIYLVSLKQCKPRSADYLHCVTVELSSGQRKHWPEMQADQAAVFKNLKKLQS